VRSHHVRCDHTITAFYYEEAHLYYEEAHLYYEEAHLYYERPICITRRLICITRRPICICKQRGGVARLTCSGSAWQPTTRRPNLQLCVQEHATRGVATAFLDLVQLLRRDCAHSPRHVYVTQAQHSPWAASDTAVAVCFVLLFVQKCARKCPQFRCVVTCACRCVNTIRMVV
jgi:hypothetical protein